MSKKEEQSKAYIKPTILYRNKNLNDNNWELGLDYLDFTGYEVQCAFEAGWDAACSEVGGEKYNCGKILNLRRKAYAKGKEDFLYKACQWLEDNLVQCWIEDFLYVQFKHREHQEKENVLADFRRAMEE